MRKTIKKPVNPETERVKLVAALKEAVAAFQNFHGEAVAGRYIHDLLAGRINMNNYRQTAAYDYAGASSTAQEQMRTERFCVIGDKSTCNWPITRNWKKTQHEAEAHAATLIRNKENVYNYHRDALHPELYVVKVVSVVAPEQPMASPITVTPASQHRFSF